MRLRSSTVKRRTNGLFHWDYRDGFSRRGVPLTIDGVVGTFTRASIKTAVDSNGRVYTVPSGQPAMHHRYNASTALWEPVGVLLERAGTNLALYSEQADDAAWTKSRTTVSANADVGPDGATTADRLIEDATAASTHRIYSAANITITADANVGFGRFLKAGTRSWALLGVMDSTETNAARSYFDLSTGALGSTAVVGTGAVANRGIDKLGNGWYWCWVSGSLGSGVTTARHYTGIATADNGANFNGDGSSYIVLGGAHAENAVLPSSYIATTSASVTRAVDFMEFSALWLPQDLTIYADMVDLGTFQIEDSARLLQLGDNDSGVDASAYIYNETPGDVRCVMEDASTGAAISDISTGAVALGDTQEVRFAVLAAGIESGRSLNSAAEVLGNIPSALAHPSAYAESVVCFTPGGTFLGVQAIRTVKIIPSERTMTQCREAV